MSYEVIMSHFETGMPTFLIIIAGLLCYASYCDIKTMEVPLYIVPVGIMIQTIAISTLLFPSGDITKALIYFGISFAYGGVLFLMSYLCMKYGNLGGADVLISFLIGYTLQIDGVLTILIAYLMALPYAAYLHVKKKKKEYPFVPFLTVAYIMVLIFEFCAYRNLI